MALLIGQLKLNQNIVTAPQYQYWMNSWMLIFGFTSLEGDKARLCLLEGASHLVRAYMNSGFRLSIILLIATAWLTRIYDVILLRNSSWIQYQLVD